MHQYDITQVEIHSFHPLNWIKYNNLFSVLLNMIIMHTNTSVILNVYMSTLCSFLAQALCHCNGWWA